MKSEYITHSPEETQAVAVKLAKEVSGRAIIALHGDLGAGKTCFVHGIARELQISKTITSPTFTVINEYMGKHPLYHMDLYRISNPDQLISLGLDDYFDLDGITVIEWAERAGSLLPENTIHIYFKVLDDPDSRKIILVLSKIRCCGKYDWPFLKHRQMVQFPLLPIDYAVF